MSDSNRLLQERLRAVEAADSAQGLLDSVEALAELSDEGAVDTLIQVLGYNNPGAAVAAVDGLIKIGTPAASALLTQIDGYNYGARAWALRVLAGIGDPRGLDLILETAVEDFSLSVRRAAARGLGAIQWEKLPEEKRRANQTRTIQTLLTVLEDVEWVVRYAAVVGLQGLAIAVIQAGLTELTEPIVSGLQGRIQEDDTLAVQARAQWALTQVQSFSPSLSPSNS
ncbi:PBS lyase HEAT-like repeat domain protein [Synechococcus sp. PCC 7335]|uniref:HEAT repeat domain-containing protein n=1 Tax=Synechococcus sp. (strain ATCC 29403 / PCC 7335) TaxID=91464 RepID=UPI00017EE38C|nr:HEAT repeat domain-containing protein [Synechococcus sp. PCC 7335]EDX86699.1 PBS lyase HEAT-like repeat domain protein [Synechococcus sp. PCC 7335]